MQKDKTLAAVFITVFTGFIGFSLPFPIFSYLFLSSESILIPATLEENIRPILLGLAIALFPIGQALASPLWGKYSDRYGRKPMLIISLVIAALGMVIVAIAIQYNLLYLVFLGRFISGLGEGNITLAQAIAADQQNEKIKARYFAAISIAMNSGWIVGPLLGGYLGDPGSASFTHPTLPFWLAALMYLCIIECPFNPSRTLVSSNQSTLGLPAHDVSCACSFIPWTFVHRHAGYAHLDRSTRHVSGFRHRFHRNHHCCTRFK